MDGLIFKALAGGIAGLLAWLVVWAWRSSRVGRAVICGIFLGDICGLPLAMVLYGGNLSDNQLLTVLVPMSVVFGVLGWVLSASRISIK